jgi:hypothetical protein
MQYYDDAIAVSFKITYIIIIIYGINRHNARNNMDETCERGVRK